MTTSVPSMRLVVLCPHFVPDTAPTGVVMTRIVEELVARGHEVHVVTALPWYRHHRIEEGWQGRWVRSERTAWGSITRVYPFPGGNKRNLVRRAFGFAGFSLLVGVCGLRAGGWRRVDAVITMSPPLILGLAGWLVSILRRGRSIFNVQDVFPDAAVETGTITNPTVIRIAQWIERITYASASAVTVLSDELRDNVTSKMRARSRSKVHVIPNFVDTVAIVPGDRMTPYRVEHGIGEEPVVMYAGNVGFSQSLELLVEAARRLPDVTFVVNGGGVARATLEQDAAGLSNVRFVDYQPAERLAEVLSSADVHAVLLRRGLGRVSVPSKIYSIMAAGRPVVASIDADSEVPRLLGRCGGGIVVPPDDAEAFTAAVARLVADPQGGRAMGMRGRSLVEAEASPAGAAASYEALVEGVVARVRGDRPSGPSTR